MRKSFRLLCEPDPLKRDDPATTIITALAKRAQLLEACKEVERVSYSEAIKYKALLGRYDANLIDIIIEVQRGTNVSSAMQKLNKRLERQSAFIELLARRNDDPNNFQEIIPWLSDKYDISMAKVIVRLAQTSESRLASATFKA